MFYKVLQTFLSFLLWYSLFLMAFAFGFYIMLHKVRQCWLFDNSAKWINIVLGYPRIQTWFRSLCIFWRPLDKSCQDLHNVCWRAWVFWHSNWSRIKLVMDFVFFSCCFCFLHCCYSHEPSQWSCCFWHRNYHGEGWDSELYNKVTNISSTQPKVSQKLPGLKQSHTWRVFFLEILLISCLSGLQSHSWPRFPAWLSVIRYVNHKTYHIWNYISFSVRGILLKQKKKGIIFLSKMFYISLLHPYYW